MALQDRMQGEADDLAARLRAEVLLYLKREAPAVGTPLTERGLAELLRVSRSPVRRVLRDLRESGYISQSETGRYQVARSGDSIGEVSPPGARDEEVYVRIASDRLDGLLPDRVTENALLRRYDLTRSRLSQLLMRISQEGWIEPLPGYGWRFLPVLTSLKSYANSYRYRAVIEPAAILEPTFTLDRDALERRREEQRSLADGGVRSVSGAELFDLNTRFHETIIECSGNDFFIEGLARINRVRRLIEYRQALVPERASIRCREHVALADLILAGRLPEASEFLRDHISTVLPEKTRD
ncbi:FCD domain-containing protein [Microbacterium sp. NPDC058345]|uniref:GntR family transcriptional regulator n=1 Tax=Microbacterium sp. NPDC058345 TaxID=3346455 RepID=UPI00365540B6